MNPNYPAVAARAGKRCEYCHAPQKCFNGRHEVEHIVPHSIKPDPGLEGLALACRSCNLFKSDRQSGADGRGGEAELFNPRIHGWDDHFELDSSMLRILAKTPIGHATLTVLQFNTEEQIVARGLWIAADAFP
jgi:HNH endonuclease